MNNLSRNQREAVEVACSGHNVFITGGAGTGKSTTIQAIMERLNYEPVCLAPTGVAALNIEGQSIHSFFGFPPSGVIRPEQVIEAAMQRKELIQRASTIVIDEISMVRADVFEAMDIACRECADSRDSIFPFGNKQIIAVGDFSQLPPVVGNDAFLYYLEHTFGGVYPFSTKSWRDADFRICRLEESHRSRDQRLLEICNAIRGGMADREDSRGRPASSRAFNRHDTLLDEMTRNCVRNNRIPDNAVVLCSERRLVEEINRKELRRLDDEGIVLKAEVTGRFPLEDAPTDPDMLLKRGERVMLLANHRDRRGRLIYANGTIGYVTDYFHDGDMLCVWVNIDGRKVEVEPHSWVAYEYELEQDGRGNLDIVHTETGSFTQFPLIPAYAMTIHKSQGLTFEDPVSIVLGDRDCFASGQLYTALTRCRTLEQISLDRPVTPMDYRLSEEVCEFYEDMGLI